MTGMRLLQNPNSEEVNHPISSCSSEARSWAAPVQLTTHHTLMREPDVRSRLTGFKRKRIRCRTELFEELPFSASPGLSPGSTWPPPTRGSHRCSGAPRKQEGPFLVDHEASDCSFNHGFALSGKFAHDNYRRREARLLNVSSSRFYRWRHSRSVHPFGNSTRRLGSGDPRRPRGIQGYLWVASDHRRAPSGRHDGL
jgi:hypothetical protein